MGYSTDFDGKITIEPALNAEEIDYLNKFSDTRRMDREKGPYYVDGGSGFMGLDTDSDIRNQNSPPDGQPGLWCEIVPTDNGDALVWTDNEKTYDMAEWMAYIIEHFVGSNPLAKSELPFLQAHTLNGTMSAQGEEADDMWLLHVENNVVSTEDLVATGSGIRNVVGEQKSLPVE